MKNLALTLLSIVFLMPLGMQAQEDSKYVSYWVHEDHVKPSMVEEYEKIGKKLVSHLKEHNVEDEAWITAQTDDMRYLYVGKMDKMADLDRPVFSTLAERMGAEEMSKLFEDMDKTYSKHFNYVIHLDKNLSYMPDGITQTPEGMDYRKFYYLHVNPMKIKELTKSMKKIKDLYASKNSKSHYRVYRSGFGAPNDFYMVAIADKDPLSYEQSALANRNLIGEAAKPLMDEVMKHVERMEVVTGYMRPDLAYNPE